MITLDEQIAEAQRELALREKCQPGCVKSGRSAWRRRISGWAAMRVSGSTSRTKTDGSVVHIMFLTSAGSQTC